MNPFLSFSIAALCFLLTTLNIPAQMLPGLAGGRVARGAEREADLSPWLALGNPGNGLEDPFVPGVWKGFGTGKSIAIPGHATFVAEQAHHWSEFYGLRLEILVPEGRSFHGRVTVHTPQRDAKSSYRTTAPVSSSAGFSLIGSGKPEIINLPFAGFDKFYPYGETFMQISKVEISGSFADGNGGSLAVPRVEVIPAPVLKLFSEARSRAGEENADLEYELKIMNCSNRVQSVNLAHHPYSKHVMKASITPEQLTLEPGETKSAAIRVNITDRVPPGGRERQKIVALANGHLGGEIEFISARKLPHPYLVHTPERWQEVRDKIRNTLRRQISPLPHRDRTF